MKKLLFYIIFGSIGLFSHSMVGQANYNIVQGSGASIYFSAPIDVTIAEDDISGPLPIGFDFTFFGNTYNTFYIDQNGFITFDPDPWFVFDPQFIPDGAFPNNLIAAMWTDLDAFGTFYSFETDGAPGDQKLYVTFDGFNFCGQYLYTQIVLWESDNRIEIHTDTWDPGIIIGLSETSANASANSCPSFATQGIEDEFGTNAFYVAGRNQDDQFLLFDDYVAFIPAADNDAGVIGNVSVYCDGPQDIETIITNAGANTIDSVTVNWTWNGVAQTPVSYINPIPPGANVLVTLGQQSLTFGDQDTLLVFTSLPNGVADPNPSNDAVESYVNVGLNGTYTIGTGEDYETFNDAIIALENTGICDSVIFNVKEGPYFEQFSIPLINGAFDDNQIIFQADPTNTAPVLIVHNATGFSDNYVARFDGAWNVTLKNIKLQNSGANFGRVLDIRNGARELEFINDTLIGKQFASNNVNFALASINTDQNGFLFDGNHFIYGSYSIYQESSLIPTTNSNTIIRNNLFDNFRYYGVRLYDHESPQIINNRFVSPDNTTEIGIGIDLAIGDSMRIEGNTFYLNEAVRGISITSSTFSGESRIANNAIYIDGFGSDVGIDLDGVDSLGIYFNSIYMNGSDPDASALGLRDYSSLDIRNNIFYNGGEGLAVLTDELDSGTGMDFNNLLSDGPYLSRLDAGSLDNFSDLESWQATTGWEASGLSVNPLFVDTFDLHTQQQLLNKQGTPIPGVVFDFDGELRNGGAPDIGADEFPALLNDLAVLEFSSPAISCDTIQNVSVRVQNAGSNLVSQYALNWSVNGALQTPVMQSGVLDTLGGFGMNVEEVNLGSFTFAASTTYLIKAWTSSPNGMMDPNALNDTVTLIYQLPLNGTYTIGSAPSDFLTIEDAIRTLDTAGICGPVRLEFKPGIYDQHVIIYPIDGASETNRLTITSQSGDTSDTKIRYIVPVLENEEAIFQLEGADHITISNLGLYVDGNFFFRPIWLNGKTEGLRIEGNHFTHRSNLNSSAQAQTIYGVAKTGDLDMVIQNNSFIGGTHGVYLRGLGINDRFSNLTIQGNTFENQNARFIDIVYGNDLVIDNNLLLRNADDGTNPWSMYIQHCDGQSVISNNNIIGTTNLRGMLLQFFNQQSPGSKVRVFNNMISPVNSNYCLSYSNSLHLECYYNNFYNAHNSNFANAFNSSESDTLDIRNNIFYSEQGPAMSIAFDTDSVYSDHNNILSNGSTQVSTWMGSYSTLADWQNASGQDLNSLAVDPLFFSSTDLHIQQVLLDQEGTPIPGITTDIDGGVRDPVSPDIGADEVFGDNLDISIVNVLPTMPFESGLQDVRAVVYNFGTDSVAQVNIDWAVNGVGQSQFNYNGLIPSNTFDTITIGQATFGFNLAYELEAYTSAPNGMADQNPGNDTIIVQDLYPAVSGELTIAGPSPDFADVFQAVAALENGGMIDAVTFSIRNGTYTDSLIFGQTDYFSCETPIIFQSESGDPADVVFENPNGTAYPLHLTGADGIKFRNITFRTLSLSYPNAVRIEGRSNCNTFEGCILEGLTTTSTSITQASVYSPGDRDTSNIFANNLILNGSYGIGISGTNSSREENNRIMGNQFTNQYFRGLYLNYTTRPIVVNNRFTSNTSHQGGYVGILLFRSNGPFDISANELSLSNIDGSGIIVQATSGLSGNKSLISNNMVQIGSSASQSAFGMYVESSSHVLVAHNSIWTGGNDTNTHAYYARQNTANTIDVLNNNFVNDATGHAMLFWLDSDANLSNYNNLLSNGDLVRKNGVYYTDLISWQATGFDANSYAEDPGFVAPDDLHVQSAFLNGTAIPLPQVPLDIDGEVRDTLTPDIGADEFNLFTDDVGILSINYPVQPFPSGVQTIFIKFSNNGVDTLTSMQVDLTVNGDTLQTYLWSGLLPSGATYDSLDIATYDFLPDSAHTIKVWVSNPNGMTDGLAANDTLEVSGLYPGLSGVYSIGPPNQQDPPDFESISDAVRVLNLGGAADAVTLNIRPGTYIDTIHIKDFPGSGCDRPVIFQSESQDAGSVLIQNDFLAQYPILIDDADGLIFQHLTVKAQDRPDDLFEIVIYIGGDSGANCNTIQNCHLIGVPTPFFDFNNAVIFDESGYDWGNVYQNNLIEESSHAINLTHSGSELSGTKVLNNQIFNYSARGIYAVGHNGIQIEGNELRSDQEYTNLTGLFMDECDSAVVIQNNQILLEEGRYGMLIYDLIASSNSPATIANNFVSIGRDDQGYGVELSAASYVNVYHNNFVNRSSRTPYFSNNTAFRINNGDSLDVRNNIFAGLGAETNALQSTNAPSYRHLDHNNYYSNSLFLASWEGVDITDLSALQVATSDDANSIAANPEFMSDLDLHVGLVLLNEAGDPTVGITEDIDGDLRGTPPDIGADEFDPAASDDAGAFAFMGPVAPFADGIQNVQVAIKNFGGNPLTSANVRWLVNGFEQTPYAWTGNLSPGACDTVTIGTFDFLPYQKHDLVIWTEQPNGVPDSTLVNDTIYLENLYPALNGSYTVGGVLPDFNLFSQLEKALNLGGIVGDVDFQIRSGYYEAQLVIGDFPRISPAHAVLFESETGDADDVTLIRNFNGPNYTVLLEAANQVTFKNMRLESTKGIVVHLSDGSENLTLDSVLVAGRENGFGSNDALIFSGSSSENGLTIRNSEFVDGAYGVLISGSNGNKEINTRIEHNTFIGQEAISISATSQSGIVVSGNTIHTEDENQNIGIFLQDCDDSLTVAQNIILMPVNGTGIHIDGSIMDAPGLGRVINNFVHVQGTQQSKGIYLDRSRRIEFYYNSILVSNTDEDSYPMEVVSTSSTLLNLENNIFANTGGGLAFYSFYNTNFSTFDYNNFYTTGPTLCRVGGIYPTILDLQINTSKNLNSVSVDPIFLSDDSFQVSQVQLDGAGSSVIGITQDIEGDVRNATTPDIGADEFAPVANDIAVVELVSPATFCGLSANENVTIRLQNRGSAAQSGFNVSYMLNGIMVTQNIGGLNVPPGGTADFTFTQQVDLSTVGLYSFKLISNLPTDSRTENDMLGVEVEHIPELVDPVSNMLPVDNAMDVDKPLSLSWGPAPNATLYDIYIWPDSESQPGAPQIANNAQINTSYDSQINYGVTYLWQVVAKNVCDQMVAGPIQSFEVRELPDLVVDTVIIPPTAFSGQEIQIEWQTRNLGPGATQGQLWTDAVYLSQDATLNTSFDTYIGGSQNLTALDSGISYTNTAMITLPEVINGNYYIFIAADRYNSLVESNNSNNSERTSAPMMITLSPAPDLKVISVTTPSNVFSGQLFPVTYTVRNDGDGATEETNWRDQLRSKMDQIEDESGIDLKSVFHTGDLEPDSTYTVNTFAEFPIETEGVRFVGVTVDHRDDVFEALADNNNTRVSDSIEVIILPPADLVVLPFNLPDTVSNNELIPIPIKIVNQGGSAAVPEPDYIVNQFYFSQSPIYNPSFLTSSWVEYAEEVLQPNDTLSLTLNVIVPRSISGTYYNYFHVDQSDNVFEYDFEDNNIYRLDTSTVVVNPDIIPLNATIPATEFAGRNMDISWIERNLGPGKLTTVRYSTFVYLSADSVFNEENATFLKSVFTVTGNNGIASTIDVTDTLFNNVNVTLPLDQTGDLYIHIVSDFNDRVLESDADSNNILTVPIEILPVPVPDLVPTQLTVPDTVFAGSAFQSTYSIENQGIVGAGFSGTDALYISFSPTWQPEFAEFLIEVPQTLDLDPDSSVTKNVSIPIDLDFVSNRYYLYVVVDAGEDLFEDAGEANNIFRSDSFFVKPYPPTDLEIDSFISIVDTVMSGSTVAATAVMKNIETGVTRSSSWLNAVYLSADMALDTLVDIRLDNVPYSEGTIAGGSQRIFDASFAIPDGLTGTYYVIMFADYADVNRDVDPLNNGALLRDASNQPKQIHIELADYPDLVMTNIVAPTTVVSGENFEVQVELSNIGSAIAGVATHRLFVSTDSEINAGDLLLQEFSSAMIDTSASWADTFEVSLPSSYDGNYFLLFRLDIQDLLFENAGEGNNDVSRVIEALLAPPADLFIQTIELPDSIFAGDEATVAWTTINQGDFPANGNLREIVYLSQDSIWDVNDQLLGLVDDAVYMPPANTRSASVSGPVQGVREESYFAIVQTDARDNINESDEDNNYATSFDQMDVQFKELIVNEWKSDTIGNEEFIYYKLELGATYANDAAIITLKGDSINGQNEMYIKYGEAPTTSDFDFGFELPFSGNQQATIPNIIPGTYYILVLGQSPMASQPFKIIAEPIGTSIQRITPKKGSNSGFVTMRIFGTKLDSLEYVQISKLDTATSEYIELRADTFFSVTSQLVIARFDLRGMPLDTYDVECVRPDGFMGWLKRSFEVIDGDPGALAVDWVIAPGRILAGRAAPVQIKVDVRNVGTTDLVNKAFQVYGVEFTEIFGSLEDFENGLPIPDSEIIVEDETGLPGVLSPGNLRTYYLYASTNGNRLFVISY